MFHVGLMTHEKWKKAHDAAGGKSGEVSGVNIGKLLDAVHKSLGNAATLKTALTKCKADSEKYIAKVKPKKPAGVGGDGR